MTDASGDGLRLKPYLEALSRGQVVACATETQVGLLADARDPRAIARVIALKGRDEGQPIALLLPDLVALTEVAQSLSDTARRLCEQHWPGPLTLVVEALPGLDAALCKDGRVGVRVPGASPALQLVRAFGHPLTATSANLSGQPAATTAADARLLFGKRVLVVPADAPGGAPSTVVAVRGGGFEVIRQGAITIDS